MSSLSSLEASFRCFLISSESLSASARSETARSRSFLSLSHRVRILSLSNTILSRSLKAQSRRRFDTSASWIASVQLTTNSYYNLYKITFKKRHALWYNLADLSWMHYYNKTSTDNCDKLFLIKELNCVVLISCYFSRKRFKTAKIHFFISCFLFKRELQYFFLTDEANKCYFPNV